MSVLRPWLVVPIVLLAACAPERAVGVDGAAPANAASLAKAASQRGGTTGASSTSGPGGDSTATEPHFVTAAADAPIIANPVVQFWAVRGQDRTGTMYYHRADGTGRDSIPLFSLRVRPHSLWKRPDGSLVADGDSVLITLTLVDAQHLVVDCQPSGLLFAPNDPARLKMSYAETDADLNDDGTVNATDQALTKALLIWRRETPTSPWLPVASNNSTELDEIEAPIGGFTGYAIAY